MSSLTDATDRALRLTNARLVLRQPGVARQLRHAAGLTLEDVAAALGKSVSTVSLWERGLRRPGGDDALRLVEFLAQILEVVDPA